MHYLRGGCRTLQIARTTKGNQKVAFHHLQAPKVRMRATDLVDSPRCMRAKGHLEYITLVPAGSCQHTERCVLLEIKMETPSRSILS